MSLLPISGNILEEVKNGQLLEFGHRAGSVGWATPVRQLPPCSFLIEGSRGRLTKWPSTPHWLASDTSLNSFDLENVRIIGDFSSCAFSTAGKENRVGTLQDPFPLCPVRLKNEQKRNMNYSFMSKKTCKKWNTRVESQIGQRKLQSSSKTSLQMYMDKEIILSRTLFRGEWWACLSGTL